MRHVSDILIQRTQRINIFCCLCWASAREMIFQGAGRFCNGGGRAVAVVKIDVIFRRNNFLRKGMHMSTKRRFISGGAFAFAMLIVGAVTVLSQAADQRVDNMAREGHAFKASELMGLAVYTTGNEEKGKIKDLLISHDGKVEYAAV